MTRRKSYFQLLALLMLLGISGLAVLKPSVLATVRAKSEAEDWAEIARLHEKGWKERGAQKYEASEISFRLATDRLERYREIYLEHEYGIRFLRATYRLGYFAELGNEDEKAKLFYNECLLHPFLHSTGAIVDGESILQTVKVRLRIVERRLQEAADQSKGVALQSKSSGKSANAPEKTYPRISVNGGSKGDEKNLPAISAHLRP